MTKFNEETTKEIIKLYNNGIPLKYCADAVGINRSTLHRWLEKGEKAKTGKHRQFYLEMQKAKSKFIAYHQKKINDSKDWKASRYLLEVTDPEHYVLQDKVKVDNTTELNINGLSELFSKEDIMRFINESQTNEPSSQ